MKETTRRCMTMANTSREEQVSWSHEVLRRCRFAWAGAMTGVCCRKKWGTQQCTAWVHGDLKFCTEGEIFE